eukprot:5128116-Amphidinium_carterae.4
MAHSCGQSGSRNQARQWKHRGALSGTSVAPDCLAHVPAAGNERGLAAPPELADQADVPAWPAISVFRSGIGAHATASPDANEAEGVDFPPNLQAVHGRNGTVDCLEAVFHVVPIESLWFLLGKQVSLCTALKKKQVTDGRTDNHPSHLAKWHLKWSLYSRVFCVRAVFCSVGGFSECVVHSPAQRYCKPMLFLFKKPRTTLEHSSENGAVSAVNATQHHSRSDSTHDHHWSQSMPPPKCQRSVRS